MSEAPLAGQGPYQGRAFRYGMLVFWLAFWCMAWWMWLRHRSHDRTSPPVNVVLVSMLLVNHVIAAFFSVEQQRRIRPVQFILLGAFLVYLCREAFFQ